MNLAISLCLYRREEETARVLASIRACPELVNLPAFASIDHSGDGAMAERMAYAVLKALPGSFLICQPVPLGCNGNTRAALTGAWGLDPAPDFVLHVEDDVVLSPDAGRYILWAAERYAADPAVFSVGLWRHAGGWLPAKGGDVCPADRVMAVGRQSAFSCWGWGTWRNRWEEINRGWTPGGDHERSWDVQVAETIRPGPVADHRVEVVPMISRAQNIGWRFGTHRGDAALAYWQTERTAGDYREVTP
jgi:hypothetical protein